jgi:hypothetical protein
MKGLSRSGKEGIIVRINVIETRVPLVPATPEEVLEVFLLALGAIVIIALVMFCLAYLFTHFMGWM